MTLHRCFLKYPYQNLTAYSPQPSFFHLGKYYTLKIISEAQYQAKTVSLLSSFIFVQTTLELQQFT